MPLGGGGGTFTVFLIGKLLIGAFGPGSTFGPGIIFGLGATPPINGSEYKEGSIGAGNCGIGGPSVGYTCPENPGNLFGGGPPGVGTRGIGAGTCGIRAAPRGIGAGTCGIGAGTRGIGAGTRGICSDLLPKRSGSSGLGRLGIVGMLKFSRSVPVIGSYPGLRPSPSLKAPCGNLVKY